MTQAYPLHWPEGRLARECHPDNGGSNERMAEINAAYEAAKRELSND